MSEGALHSIILGSFNALLFVALVTMLFIFAYKFDVDNKLVKENSYRKEAVTAFPEDMDAEEKDYISGAAVLSEILSFPDGTYIRVNGTAISELKANTGEDYITYARKYGTQFLENQVSMLSNYKREVTLDDNGNVTGVSYIIAY